MQDAMDAMMPAASRSSPPHDVRGRERPIRAGAFSPVALGPMGWQRVDLPDDLGDTPPTEHRSMRGREPGVVRFPASRCRALRVATHP